MWGALSDERTGLSFVNCQLLLVASRYIASGLASEKTSPLPSIGCTLLLCIVYRAVAWQWVYTSQYR
jgi:hypothetical protein